MNSAIWVFIGTIVGALTSILTTMISSQNSIKLQNELEKSKREIIFLEFQKNNLIKLQEVLYQNLRLLTKSHLEDLENYKKTKTWGKLKLSNDLDDSIGNSIREVWIYIERIDDNKLRGMAKDFTQNFSLVLLSKEKNEAASNQMLLMKEFENLMTELGDVLRKTY